LAYSSKPKLKPCFVWASDRNHKNAFIQNKHNNHSYRAFCNTYMTDTQNLLVRRTRFTQRQLAAILQSGQALLLQRTPVNAYH